MRVTKDIVSTFEYEQKTWGTELAIMNLLWQLAAEIYKDIGVTRIRTGYKKK